MAVMAGALAAGAIPGLAQDVEQAASGSGNPVKPHDLLRVALAPIPNAEVTLLILTVLPGSVSHPHHHTGPVFAYILEGTVENQVEPEPPKTYAKGDFFYEPPMHVHRQLKNLSATETARILVFEVGEQGKPFTVTGS